MCKQFEDFGEIDPNYSGFKKIKDHFVLIMNGVEENPYGFCVFIPEKIDIVQIDIIVIRKELRRRGLGRILLGYLERSCMPGTVLYVKDLSNSGRKFFLHCGFTKDINLFKVT